MVGYQNYKNRKLQGLQAPWTYQLLVEKIAFVAASVTYVSLLTTEEQRYAFYSE